MEKLVVIESINKVKTLEKFLGSDYEIFPTIGHIRDLSSVGYGFNKDYDPIWVISQPKKNKNDKIIKSSSKEEVVKQLKLSAKKAKEIYIATDPDREGEAIAWHVYEVLDKESQAKCKRITFNEITKEAILASLENKRDIDLNWVHSQFTRRIADRLIGFKLSGLLQKKSKGRSAGRVQSVALLLLAEQEEKIKQFVETIYWSLDVVLQNKLQLLLKKIPEKYSSEIKLLDKPISSSFLNIATKKDAEVAESKLDKQFKIVEINQEDVFKSAPKAAYKTSTLQQDAINKLNWTAKRVTDVSQRLYEGVEIDGNQIALISYPRTDSTRISESFKSQIKQYITDNFGKEYLGSFSGETKSKDQKNLNIQDAHEAIRPISLELHPSVIKPKVNKDIYALYKLIYERTVACFMANAKYLSKKFVFNNNDFIFSAEQKVLVFDGFLKVKQDEAEKEESTSVFANLKVGDSFEKLSCEIKQHKTQPPARYNQASLIAALEKKGIGRPSTYNTIANVALDRGYAELQNRSYVLSDTGKEVIKELKGHFDKVINTEFTKELEERLDQIAKGNEHWKQWLLAFGPEFDEYIKQADKQIEKTPDEPTGENCPECNCNLVYKTSWKYKSKFVGCSNYPSCKYVQKINKTILKSKEPCPICQSDMYLKTSPRKGGSSFLGCSKYPKCNYLIAEEVYTTYKSLNPGIDKLPSKEDLEEFKKKHYGDIKVTRKSIMDKTIINDWIVVEQQKSN